MADETSLPPDPHLLTPELAATELADAPGDDMRSGTREREAPVTPRVVGRFRVDARLGAGGMGDVYRAFDTVLDRPVALKVLRTDRSGDDAQRMRRVVREARAAAALTHPNAVTIFDVGEADKEVFIAMELLDGEDLRSVIERGDASLDDKLRWLLEAARALHAAHARGLVHRDVKPENMFVCKGGTLKLLDFGIAKRDDEDGTHADVVFGAGPSSLRTTEGRRVGTPRYMAPEQHAGDATDPRTDEFAWGLVAFELLTGSHVVADLATMTVDGTARPVSAAPTAVRVAALRAKAPELPASIIDTIARALEPRKEDRFPSMAPIIAALEKPDEEPVKALAALPERAAPAPSPSPASPSRLPRRAALAALAIVLVVGVAVAWKKLGMVPRPPSPALKVASSRTLSVAADDRFAILLDGTLVLARGTKTGLRLEREVPGGATVPMLRSPMFAAIGASYEGVELRGTSLQGLPAVFVEMNQGERGAFVGVWTDTIATSQRIFGPVSGIATAPFGKNVAIIATTNLFPPRRSDQPNGAEAYLVTATAVPRSTIEVGGATSPALATKDDRVAVAYVEEKGLHFAFLDRDLQRAGDVLEVSKTSARPAVAFAGDEAVVFWVEDQGGKTRLTGASLPAGNTAFSPAKVAIDEPLGPRAPVTARLPDGRWLVAWIASTGGVSSLRASPIGPGGSLTGPTDIAKAASIDGLRMTSTGEGVDFSWYEGDGTVRISRVISEDRSR
jgi:serine/threonine protein kinase